jgi:2-polyprenyl-3-methyl-5-hydroxy-6-metoxy-1,4-benzoquinol methylase
LICQKRSYELIFMLMTIEHVERPDETLLGIKRLLKRGGKAL